MATPIIISRDGHDIAGISTRIPTNAEAGILYFDTTHNVLLCSDGTDTMRTVVGHVGVFAVTALGSSQSNAAALTGGSFNNVTGADGTKGVVLASTAPIGDIVLVYNNSSSFLPVYPAGSGTINGGTAAASISIPPQTLATLVAVDATIDWSCDLASNDTGAIIANSLTGGQTPFVIAGQVAQTTTGTGGALTINSGAGGSSSGSAGAIAIAPGTATSGAGATTTISGGNGAGGTSAGGSINLVPGTAVSTGVPGEIQVNGNSATMFESDTLTATDATRTLIVMQRACRLKSVSSVFTTASSSGAFTLEKATGTTAPGSGTVLLTGTVTLAGSANTVASGTPIATVASLTFAAGDRLNIVISGTMTNLVGQRLTVGFTPV